MKQPPKPPDVYCDECQTKLGTHEARVEELNRIYHERCYPKVVSARRKGVVFHLVGR